MHRLDVLSARPSILRSQERGELDCHSIFDFSNSQTRDGLPLTFSFDLQYNSILFQGLIFLFWMCRRCSLLCRFPRTVSFGWHADSLDCLAFLVPLGNLLLFCGFSLTLIFALPCVATLQ